MRAQPLPFFCTKMSSYIECLCCSGNKWDAFKRSLNIFINYSCISLSIIFTITALVGSPIVFIISIIKLTSNGEDGYIIGVMVSGIVIMVEFLILIMLIRDCILGEIKVKKLSTRQQSNMPSAESVAREELPQEPSEEPVAVVISDPT